MKKHIAILGSTGSIGTQALEVINNHPDKFVVEILTAHNNVKLLIEQAEKYVPNAVVITKQEKYNEVARALSPLPVKVFAGTDAIAQVVQFESVDIVLTAMVGYCGLLPTIKAIEAKKDIAMANKETLVVAGELIQKLVHENNINIFPVDSEHSAIFQCLAGETGNAIEKIYLTASGGPFRGKDQDFLKGVTREEALKHPNWNMGNKVTIDSATLMNKGLEVIEAHWLFNLKPEQIEVVIHPQSIIHSIVQFEDGSMKAQMGLPDMKLPIQYALGFPHRLKSEYPRFHFSQYPNLTFEPPDLKNFRNLTIAFEVMRRGGNLPCIMNAANEVAVAAFLEERLTFLRIPEIIEKTLEKASFVLHPSYHDYKESDREARSIAESLLN